MFKNLQAEMARIGIGMKDIAKAINRSYDTTRGRLKGRSEFSLSEMDRIKNTYFPTLEISYLFKREEEK